VVGRDGRIEVEGVEQLALVAVGRPIMAHPGDGCLDAAESRFAALLNRVLQRDPSMATVDAPSQRCLPFIRSRGGQPKV
jgi:hypothetical protein